MKAGKKYEISSLTNEKVKFITSLSQRKYRKEFNEIKVYFVNKYIFLLLTGNGEGKNEYSTKYMAISE